MLVLGDSPATLAVAREDHVILYQRYFERASASWRYRAVARQRCDDGAWMDHTGFRARHPKAAARALDRLEGVTGLGARAALDQAPNSADQLPPDLAKTLALYADFYRFFQVNALLVRQALATPLGHPVNLGAVVPPMNLALALDLMGAQAQMLDTWAPAIEALVLDPQFRDDTYALGAGAARAVSDLALRAGDRARAHRALSRSQALRPSTGKAARLVRLAPADAPQAGVADAGRRGDAGDAAS